MIGSVYIIRNKLSGNCYVGASKNFKKRMAEHKNDLYRNIHHSYKLQKAYNRIGLNNFEYIIITTCPIEYLRDAEQLYIDGVNSIYNISRDSTRPLLGVPVSIEKRNMMSEFHKNNTYNLGRKASKQVKEKMSKSRIGGKLSDATKIKLKDKTGGSILQYTKNGEFIAEFKSITEASEQTSIPRQTISQVCRNQYKIGYGFMWKYKNEPNSSKRKIIDLNTNKIYNSIRECSEELNIHRNSINNSLSGKNKSYKNLQYYN